MLCGPRWEAGVEVEGEGTASGDDGRTFPNATSTATCRPEQLREPRAGGTASWRAGAGEGRGAGEVGPAQRPPPRPPPPGDGTRPGRRGGSLRGPKEPLRLSCSQQNASHTQTKAFPGKRRLRERTEGLAPKGPGRRAAGTADAGGGLPPTRGVFPQLWTFSKDNCTTEHCRGASRTAQTGPGRARRTPPARRAAALPPLASFSPRFWRLSTNSPNTARLIGLLWPAMRSGAWPCPRPRCHRHRGVSVRTGVAPGMSPRQAGGGGLGGGRHPSLSTAAWASF